MFDVEAAQELVEGSRGKPPLAQKLSGEDGKQLAKKAALAARSASRTLQGLPSKVITIELHPLPKTSEMSFTYRPSHCAFACQHQ